MKYLSIIILLVLVSCGEKEQNFDKSLTGSWVRSNNDQNCHNLIHFTEDEMVYRIPRNIQDELYSYDYVVLDENSIKLSINSTDDETLYFNWESEDRITIHYSGSKYFENGSFVDHDGNDYCSYFRN